MALKHVCLALGLAVAFVPAALADPFRVKVAQTVTLKLAAPADSVVIGNTLLVTGKAYGATNIMVLGKNGQEIYSNQIAVAGSDPSALTIVRGDGTYTYSCIEKCRPTPAVGDAPGHFQQLMATVNALEASGKGQ
jgi:hypothetical protein